MYNTNQRSQGQTHLMDAKKKKIIYYVHAYIFEIPY